MADLSSPPETGPGRERLLAAFGGAVVLSIVLGLVPYGRMIIYPFALFATWAHEMGHGVGAWITGNSFIELELYRSLGGQALIGGADGWSQVVVSAMGLLGPALLGAAVMIAGSRASTAPYVLGALAAMVFLSVLLKVRNPFGFVAMLLIGVALAAIARWGTATLRIVFAQLLAVQLALSAWSTRDYLFVSTFERNGTQRSDTQAIADEWFLPHWFWGALIGGLSIVVLVWAFWTAWLRPMTDEP